MALKEDIGTITRPAAGDLSAGQYRFVELNSSGQVSVCNGAGELSVGVLQDKPDAAGRAACVAYRGVSKIVLAATLNPNAKVSTDANGAAVASTSTAHVLGVLVKGGAAGDIGEVLLGCPGILA